MIDTKTEQRIIHKRAEGKGINKIAKELNISNDPVSRVDKEKKAEILQKRIELQNKTQSLSERILFYAKQEQVRRLSENAKAISDNALTAIINEHDKIQRLDTNKPTSITDSKKLANATNMELLNEYEARLNRIRSHSAGTRETQVQGQPIPTE